jgi:hypothetical protein
VVDRCGRTFLLRSRWPAIVEPFAPRKYVLLSHTAQDGGPVARACGRALTSVLTPGFRAVFWTELRAPPVLNVAAAAWLSLLTGASAGCCRSGRQGQIMPGYGVPRVFDPVRGRRYTRTCFEAFSGSVSMRCSLCFRGPLRRQTVRIKGPGSVISGSSSVVEHRLAKARVASSNLVSRSKLLRHGLSS